jgi:hypothetical protein
MPAGWRREMRIIQRALGPQRGAFPPAARASHVFGALVTLVPCGGQGWHPLPEWVEYSSLQPPAYCLQPDGPPLPADAKQ